MTLKPGETLGHYQIVSAIGAGGMGEVYRTRDTLLKRDVALKVLSPEVASDPDRLMRFQREAEVLASLNHPNIAQIYGIEDRALVMELVEGENLRPPLPLKTALEYARQIAEALEYAHEKGVVHRDLKPGNVMVTPQGVVKLLDFGLAKAVEKPVFASSPEESPTVTMAATRAGMIMGTAAYMSPEQAAGKPVDKRSDVWSFGVVLWEMLTGTRLFQADSLAETLADVLRADIDLTKLPPDVPEPVRELLARCLDRDPKNRLRDLGEARVLLGNVLSDPSNLTTRETLPAAPPRRRAWLAIGTVMAVLAIAAVIVYSNRPKSAPGPRQVQSAATVPDTATSTAQALASAAENAVSAVASVVSPNKPKPVPGPEHWKQITNFPNAATNPALSRDGRMLAFTLGTGWFMGNNEIYVKLLPDGPATPYTNDGLGKMFPAFSPDGSRIAYTAGGRGFNIWSVPVLAGGRPEPMLEKAEGLTWIDEHRILFSEGKGGGAGMGIETADENRASQREIYLPLGGMAHFSSLSPDGKQLLVVEMVGTGPWTPCRLMPFDGSSHGRQVGPLGKPEQMAKSLPAPGRLPPPTACTAATWSPDGKWMYFTVDEGHGSHIWRQRIDSDTPEQITFGPTGEQGLAVAPDGKSIYTSVGASQRPSLWIHDAKGDRQISGEGDPSTGVFSPDGTRVYYAVQSETTRDLWFTDLKTGRSALALPSAAAIVGFRLSEDGKSVFYITAGGQLWIAGLDPPSPPREVPLSQSSVLLGNLPAWGASGQLYFLGQQGADVHYFTIKPDGSDLHAFPDAVLVGRGDRRFFQVSPDERWLIDGGIASPLAGGTSIELCDCAMVSWSTDHKAALYTFRALGNGVGSTVAVPLKPGEIFPTLSPGRHTKEELAKLPGAVVIPFDFVDVRLGARSWVYHKSNAQQNIFQIPLE